MKKPNMKNFLTDKLLKKFIEKNKIEDDNSVYMKSKNF